MKAMYIGPTCADFPQFTQGQAWQDSQDRDLWLFNPDGEEWATFVPEEFISLEVAA